MIKGFSEKSEEKKRETNKKVKKRRGYANIKEALHFLDWHKRDEEMNKKEDGINPWEG